MAGQKVSKRSGEMIHTQTRRRHLEVCRKSSAKAKITLGVVLEESVKVVACGDAEDVEEAKRRADVAVHYH